MNSSLKLVLKLVSNKQTVSPSSSLPMILVRSVELLMMVERSLTGEENIGDLMAKMEEFKSVMAAEDVHIDYSFACKKRLFFKARNEAENSLEHEIVWKQVLKAKFFSVKANFFTATRIFSALLKKFAFAVKKFAFH